MANRFLIYRAVLIVGAVLVSTSEQVLAAGDVFDQFFRYAEREHKVFFQDRPGETVDPFTGTLRIVQVDLTLPGKAGLDVRIVRTYNSKIWGRSDLLDAEPLLAEKEHSVLGYGWSLHYGRIKNPNAAGEPGSCGTANYPVYEAPDGTGRTFYPAAGSTTVLVSKDYWRMEKNCSALAGAGTCIWSDTGIRYEFSSSSTNAYFYGATTLVWPLSAIVDAFGNRIAVTYLPQSGAISTITDTYGAGTGRVLNFAYHQVEDGLRLDTITANGNIYRYFYTTYTPAQTTGTGMYTIPGTGRQFLTEVRPPAGPSYLYQYGVAVAVVNNQYALSVITYPSGGTSSYSYSTDGAAPGHFFTGNDTIPLSVVSQRVVGGRGVTSGTWTYSYTAPGPGTALNVTTVGRPDGKQDIYSFYGFGYVAGKNAAGFTWMVGLLQQISKASGLEVETFAWDPRSAAPVSSSPYSAPSYSSTCTSFLWDNAVYAPVMTQRSITRDATTYSTNYSAFDSYGQPKTVTESGQRTTTWTFFSAPTTSSGATLNMVRGYPLTQHVCVGTDCFDNSWTYAGPNFTRDSETRTGVKTTFGYDAFGNMSTVTNALGETLTLSGYDIGKGVPTGLNFNSAFSNSRTLSWEGLVLSVTDGRNNVTSYAYDAAGRTTSVTPPGTSNITTYTYAPDGSGITLSRGTYSKATTVDGLGRVTGTSDSEGVLTSFRYDNMGRLWFKSYSYDATVGEVGEAQTAIDGLGRPTTIQKAYRPGTATCDVASACTITNSYASNSVTTTVARAAGDSAITTRAYTTFGNPDEQRLSRVTDALGNVWTYTYNVHGDLKTVTAPLAVGNRTYSYDGITQFLVSETKAESGTTTYGRNAIGQVTTRTDSRAIVTTNGYKDSLGNPDPLSRLRTITYGQTGSPDDVVMSYDNSNNLTNLSTTNSGTIAVTYDELNRATSRVWTLSGVTYTTTVHYNAAGCLDSLTYQQA